MFLLIYFKYLRSRHNYWVNGRALRADRGLNVGDSRTDQEEKIFVQFLHKELVTISVKMKKDILHTLELIPISFTSCERNFLKLVTSHGPSTLCTFWLLVLLVLPQHPSPILMQEHHGL